MTPIKTQRSTYFAVGLYNGDATLRFVAFARLSSRSSVHGGDSHQGSNATAAPEPEAPRERSRILSKDKIQLFCWYILLFSRIYKMGD